MRVTVYARGLLAGLACAASLTASAQSPVANPLNWRTAYPERILDFEPDRLPDVLSAPNDSVLFITSGIHGQRLYRTTNRGLTWSVSAVAAPAGTKTFFSATAGVVSYDSSAALPARRRGQLRFTADGGDSWEAPRAAPTGTTLFLSATEALVFQQRPPGTLVVYRTTNAGLAWSVRDSLVGLPRLNNVISAPSANTAYMFVGDSVVRQVIQLALGRHTWRVRPLPSALANVYASSIEQILFTTDSSGVARDVSGFEQRLFATTNGGRTWSVVPSPQITGGVNNSFALLDGQHALVHDDFPGQQSDLLRRAGSGTSWTQVPMDDYTAQPAGPGDFGQFGGFQSSFAGAEYAALLLRPSGVAWATGGGGRIYYSTDFGATFTMRSRLVQADEPRAAGFPDPRYGYVMTTGDALMRTADGGQTWQRLPNTPLDVCYAGAFPDADSVFLVTTGKVRRSTDGGQSWTTTNTPGFSTIWESSIAFFGGARRGLLVGEDGDVVRTTDGGQTWQTGSSGTTDDLKAVAWADAQTAFATSAANVFKTTDAGATWQPLATRPTSTSYGPIAFATPTIGVLNANHHLYRTTDGGLTWAQLPGTHDASSIKFSSPAVGWTTTHVSLDSGQTWTERPLRMQGLPVPIDADNGYAVNSTVWGVSLSGTAASARVVRYSKHFLRTAPLAQTNLAQGSSYAVAFAMEGSFAPVEQDFRVELSNALGRFRPGQTTVVGSGAASPITVVIPASVPLGSRYRLRVVRADGSVLGADNGQDLTVQRATGLAPEAEVLAPARLYPNPAQRAVTVSFGEGAQTGRVVRLLDLSGRVLQQLPAATAETRVELTNLPAGCYLVQVRTADGRQRSQRLVVQP